MQNYYIYSVQARREGAGDDNLLKKETSYLDLSHHTGGVTIERTIKCQEIAEAEAVVILLLRITEECYNYQVSLYEANSANQGSITSPGPAYREHTGCARDIHLLHGRLQIRFPRKFSITYPISQDSLNPINPDVKPI